MKSACVTIAKGCYRSRLDAALFVDYFRNNGWKIVTKFGEADIVLVSSCGFKTEEERQSIKYLSIANRKKKRPAQLVAFGCLAGINEPLLHEKFNLIAITKRTLSRLDELIDAKVKIEDLKHPNDMSEYTPYIRKSFNRLDRYFAEYDVEFSWKFFQRICSAARSGTLISPFTKLSREGFKDHKVYDDHAGFEANQIYYLKVASGCNGSCTYCAIKLAAGPLESKPLSTIVKDFENGLSKGYKVFRLVAEDIGAYGEDIGTNVVELLCELFKHDGEFRLIWDDFSPKWLIRHFPQLFDTFTRNGNKMGLIGFPIQSGSDRILELMKREHKAEDFVKCIFSLLKTVPGLCLKTHALVGFPGETERDFLDTLNLLQRVPFKKVLKFAYADRPNTPSSEMRQKVPEEVKKSRLLRLTQMLSDIDFDRSMPSSI